MFCYLHINLLFICVFKIFIKKLYSCDFSWFLLLKIFHDFRRPKWNGSATLNIWYKRKQKVSIFFKLCHKLPPLWHQCTFLQILCEVESLARKHRQFDISHFLVPILHICFVYRILLVLREAAKKVIFLVAGLNWCAAKEKRTFFNVRKKELFLMWGKKNFF